MPSVAPLIYIRNAISEGRSANSAYREMRKAIQTQTQLSGEQWSGIGRQSFLRLFSETLAARQKVGPALDYDVDQLPDQSVTTDRPSRFSKGYITWLTIYTRQQGQSDIETEFFAVHSREPITPAQAFQTAKTGFDQNAQTEHGSHAGYSFIGATYSGTWRMQPQTSA